MFMNCSLRISDCEVNHPEFKSENSNHALLEINSILNFSKKRNLSKLSGAVLTSIGRHLCADHFQSSTIQDQIERLSQNMVFTTIDCFTKLDDELLKLRAHHSSISSRCGST
jgi:N-acyl-L-homoserine lactone synthetase